MNDYFYTINGRRIAVIDGRAFYDSLSMADLLQGQRKTNALTYLESKGCSRDIGEEYLENLTERSIYHEAQRT